MTQGRFMMIWGLKLRIMKHNHNNWYVRMKKLFITQIFLVLKNYKRALTIGSDKFNYTVQIQPLDWYMQDIGILERRKG